MFSGVQNRTEQRSPAAKCLTIVHSETSSGWGGQEIRVFAEMRACRQRGHRLLLCAPPNTRIYEKCAEAGFPIFPINDNRFGYPATIARLAAFFRQQRVDVVNTHSSRDGWIAGIAARLAGVPLLIRSRHIEVDYPNRLLSRIAFRALPHHVITTSQRISDRLIDELHVNARRVSCIATGVDLSRFNPEVTGTLHRELSQPASVALVGMVSVLRSWKGHPDFLNAAKILADQAKPVHFVIAGEGDGRPDITARIQKLGLENRVTLLGHREDVPQVLASLDVLVLPSTAHEGIPQILLQGQAMAKAIVATEVGGIPEIVQDGETGLLVPARNPQKLAEQIGRVLNDPLLRRQLGERALDRARRDYSLETMCDRLDEVYQHHLQRKQS
jgi:glycosyltransferase involved in cell wall biosynthesis